MPDASSHSLAHTPQSSGADYPLSYIPAIDGIRGVLIFGIFVAHLDLRLFPGAIAFLDVFFVISGFLITSVLLRARERTGHLPYRSFYLRRAARLFPAYYLMLAAYVAYSFLFFDDLTRQLRDTFVSAVYVSNWTKAFDFTFPHFLGHTWSLSVEEQFYLTWPPLLALLFAFRLQRRGLVIALAGLSLLCTIWRIHLATSGAHFIRLYHATDVRFDALYLGGIAALLMPVVAPWVRERRTAFNLAGLVAVLMLATAVFLSRIDAMSYYIVWQPVLFFTTATLALVVTVDRDGMASHLFSFAPLRFLGLRCYGLYVWHYPILKIMEEQWQLSLAERALYGGALTLAVSMASFRFVEKPFMSHRQRYGNESP